MRAHAVVTHECLMQFGQRVRTARLQAGYTQAELARHTGIDPSTISRIEAGNREPGILVGASLAKTLGTWHHY